MRDCPIHFEPVEADQKPAPSLSVQETPQPILKRTSGHEITSFPKGLNEVTAEIQRLPHISEGEMEIVDYEVLRADNWKLQKSEPDPKEDQEGQQSVVVDLVYNTYEERKARRLHSRYRSGCQ